LLLIAGPCHEYHRVQFLSDVHPEDTINASATAKRDAQVFLLYNLEFKSFTLAGSLDLLSLDNPALEDCVEV